MNIKYQHTDRTDAAIRRAYADPAYATQRGHAIAIVSKQLGWPRHTVYRRAVKIGALQQLEKTPPWSQAESDLLEQHAHKHPITISRIFKSKGFARTPSAIAIRIKRELAGLRQAKLDAGYMSANQASACLGVDGKTVTRYIEKGWLKAKREGTARTEAQHGDHWLIREKDLRVFIIHYTAHLHFGKMDKFWLVDILTGGLGEKST